MTDAASFDAAGTADAAAAAAISTAEERGHSTTGEDVAACATAACAVAAGAVCGAYTGGLAAPVCAWLADTAIGWLSGKIVGWFTDDRMAEYQRRRANVKAMLASQALAWELSASIGAQQMDALADLQALHASLYPGSTWTAPGRVDPVNRPALLLMADNGLELSETPVIDAAGNDTGDTLLGMESIVTYWYELDALGISTARKNDLVSARAEEQAAQITRAYLNSVLSLGAVRLVDEITLPRPVVRSVGGLVEQLHRAGVRSMLASDRAALSASVASAPVAGTVPTVTIPLEQQKWTTASAIMAGTSIVGALASLLAVLRP